MYEYVVKKVYKVVDGDTIDVDIDLGFNISFFQRVRLAGIDTPESRTTDKNEKVLGLEVKKRLDEILKAATKVVIRKEKPDSTEKYGRILGWVFVDDQKTSINEDLIKDGFAWEYMGETKIKDFDLLKKKRIKSGK